MASRQGDIRGETAFTHPLQGGPAPDEASPEPARPAATTPQAQPVRRVALETALTGLGGLKYLAAQSNWRQMMHHCKQVQASGELTSVADKLVTATFHVLSMTKLRMFAAAMDELKTVGDLDQPQYQYTNAKGVTCSHVPFALRYLGCELLHHLGQAEACLTALYALLDQCRAELALSQSSGATSAPEEASGPAGAAPAARIGTGEEGTQCWFRRQDTVLYTLLNHHIAAKDFSVALQWMERLLDDHPRDPVVLSRVGYVLLQIGDVEGAKSCFAAVEELSHEARAAPQSEGGEGAGGEARLPTALLQGLVHRNTGLLKFAQKDFANALTELGVAIEFDSWDVASVNNYAVCLMYTRDLLGAMRFLEETLKADPEKYLHETLVLNLCSMYELSWQAGVDSKRRLAQWVQQIGLDDFDLTCTRMAS